MAFPAMCKNGKMKVVKESITQFLAYAVFKGNRYTFSSVVQLVHKFFPDF